jgi:purine-binding chemotaxis protein CheW
VEGVLNLRGNIVPVIDLHQLFGLSPLVVGASTVTIVLNLGSHTVGVVADAVNDVVELREQDIKATPGFSGAIKASHITGIGTLRTAEDRLRMLILIDVQELLSSAGVLSEAMPEAA